MPKDRNAKPVRKCARNFGIATPREASMPGHYVNAMHSKNKKAQTKDEAQHVAAVVAQPCVVCDAEGCSEAHEPEQGLWFISLPLCPACHRGPQGWHGDRLRWKLRNMTELKAINETHRRLHETR